MGAVVQYFRERFPVAGVLLVGVCFALIVRGLNASNIPLSICALLVIFFGALLLRTRIVDEFKDTTHDAKNYPDRPYQRGLISKRQLVIIGCIAFVIELATVYGVGGLYSLAWYMPALVYSLLMACEFFASQWLARHFTLYFVTHEILFILLGLWLIAVSGQTNMRHAIAWLILFVALMASVEIARKFELRHDKKGRVVADTYPAVWGYQGAITVTQLLFMTAGVAASYGTRSLVPAGIMTIGCVLLWAVSAHRMKFVQSAIGITIVTMSLWAAIWM